MANPTFTCPFQGDHKEIKDIAAANAVNWNTYDDLREDETIYFIPNDEAAEILREKIDELSNNE